MKNVIVLKLKTKGEILHLILTSYSMQLLTPVAARSISIGLLLAVTVGSYPAGGMDVLSVVIVVCC
jgi:hypothetical protein